MGGAVSLAAVLAALFFDFRIELSEDSTLSLRIFPSIQFGISLGKIEMDFRAAGVEFHGSFELLRSVFKFAGIEEAATKHVMCCRRAWSKLNCALRGEQRVGRTTSLKLDEGALDIGQLTLRIDA